MAARKTQKELEQPAKNYQIEAVENNLKNLTNEMRSNFTTVNQNIQTLITKSEGQVSPQTFQESLTALRTSIEQRIEEEVEKIHLRYAPMKDNLKWLLRTVVVTTIGILGQIMFTLYIVNRG